MDGPGGETLLSELELIETSLYFDLGPGSAATLAQDAARRVESMESSI